MIGDYKFAAKVTKKMVFANYILQFFQKTQNMGRKCIGTMPQTAVPLQRFLKHYIYGKRIRTF